MEEINEIELARLEAIHNAKINYCKSLIMILSILLMILMGCIKYTEFSYTNLDNIDRDQEDVYEDEIEEDFNIPIATL